MYLKNVVDPASYKNYNYQKDKTWNKTDGGKNQKYSKWPQSKNAKTKRTESFDYSDGNNAAECKSKENIDSDSQISLKHKTSTVNEKNVLSDRGVNESATASSPVEKLSLMIAKSEPDKIEANTTSEMPDSVVTNEVANSKFHNPSIYCIRNCSSWRLKVRKSVNQFSSNYK